MKNLFQLLLQRAELDKQTNLFVTVDTKDQFGTNGTYLLKQNDPFALIKEYTTPNQLNTVFTDDYTLLKALPHLSNFKDTAIVINVCLTYKDYSVIPALKDLNIISFISNSNTAAIHNTNLANTVASKCHTAVLHFINYENSDQDLLSETDMFIPIDTIHKDQASTSDEILADLDYFTLSSTGSNSPSVLIVNLSSYENEFKDNLPSLVSLININIYRPWKIEKFLNLVPSSIRKIVIVQGSCKENNNSQIYSIEPLLLDFFSDFNKLVERNIDQVILTRVGLISSTSILDSLDIIIANVKRDSPVHNLFVGKCTSESDNTYSDLILSSIEHTQTLENAYFKVLHQLFASNLKILNEFNSDSINANSPEYGFGYLLNFQEKRNELVNLIKNSLDATLFGEIPTTEATELVELLSKWVDFQSNHDISLEQANDISAKIFGIFQEYSYNQAIRSFLDIAPTLNDYLFKSNWLIGSDSWSYDLGTSGVHQVLTSKQNVNMLIIDSEPFSSRKNVINKYKKNVGLYALNFHTVYVASVAVYSSYTQLLTSIIEAAKFNGPSIIIAYLPYSSMTTTPIDILKESKIAVESGYWPLYRYDPSIENEENSFKLDSSNIRAELQEFLDRENKLTLLTKKYPSIEPCIEQSVSDVIAGKRELKNAAALDELLNGLAGPPLKIYYASDGGNASNVANRLSTRGVARGLKASVLSMEDIIIDDLSGENNIVLITSTAGQGEFPQDGKSFWEQLKSVGQLDLSNLKFSVFGLGDSQYWPRKEDIRYYNKPSKDLFSKLESLGATVLIPLGLGDDQDDDGYETGYQLWENQLWMALGVDNVAVDEEPKELTAEDVKLQSNFLRGTLAADLVNDTSGNITGENTQIAKFHGLYMQDDRDIRGTRKGQGLEPLYAFMARVRTPHGTATPEQWLLLDKLSNETGNGTIKLTNRATFQLHGVLKKDIKHTIRAMNSLLMDTLAGSGDVNRDVMISAVPENAKIHDQLVTIGKQISEYFLPKTTAYHEIWLEGIDDRDDNQNWSSIFENRPDGPRKQKSMVSGHALVDIEPIYSPVYLPRKFKVNIAAPPYNDVDVWSSDVGLISIINPETKIIEGFNFLAGGGMGTTHNNNKTWPDTGKLLGFVTPNDVIKAIESVIIFQRDHGNRTNRKNARLRYTINTFGFDNFKSSVEERMGFKFQPARSYRIDSNIDKFGWVKDETGLNHFTAFIENGRVLDTVNMNQKTGLKKIAEVMKINNSGSFRLTGNQHVIISNIEDQHLQGIKILLKEFQLDNIQFSGLRLSSSSCVGLPTCGLAMAESERFFPIIVTEIESTLEEFGLRHDSIVLRITGCPNGCSRPWLAEVALIGKAPNIYNIMLGGGYSGNRLNKLYKSNIKDSDICEILKPLFKKWALEREDEEHFGDFLIRKDIIKETTEGKFIHENIAQEAY
ncbi:similar to Saccharomyces cerevisiae YJR137C MET5 Sulfite reductase beta subunit, involved in amino acid biosynthesis, transcription repressed by methionine [Maudiozyma saulgeensis]|uniref:assimilatory sulfite reductase (NADPH) n=1 Tax=Maudiozyma saulgeensis TaxID=1789683 RepID=A0A1X7R4C2_9SACH|nr:similar to Saccharomyces cerevisiae YJR137C MET5 Sulfite reductase beta subunit, involved in amino acid biosynthesis, transcription repressed by methionine [Kazachstania saulgeensis]